MARISLRETYDNRSVIAQIAKVTDTAEDAAETVQEKAAEINDALTDVNAAVQAAEGAVTTANAASASAQQSAQTVAGYNTRLITAEGEIDTLQSDLNSVTLRVQTAEGDIVTIQGRVTALETADGQNIKLTGTHAIGNYAVLLTGNQTKSGQITFTTTDPLIVKSGGSWAGPTATFYLKRVIVVTDEDGNPVSEFYPTHDANGQNHTQICTRAYIDNGEGVYNVSKRACLDVIVSSATGKARVVFVTPNGTNYPITDWLD